MFSPESLPRSHRSVLNNIHPAGKNPIVVGVSLSKVLNINYLGTKKNELGQCRFGQCRRSAIMLKEGITLPGEKSLADQRY
jgi:hypothetical protein